MENIKDFEILEEEESSSCNWFATGFIGFILGFFVFVLLLVNFGIAVPDIEKFGETICEDNNLSFEGFEKNADTGIVFYCHDGFEEPIDDGYLLKVPKGSTKD